MPGHGVSGRSKSRNVFQLGKKKLKNNNFFPLPYTERTKEDHSNVELNPTWIQSILCFESTISSLIPSFIFSFTPPYLTLLPPVVLSRQQRRVQLMRIRQREERLKKERETKKKKKRQSNKPSHKPKSITPHHHQQYHHPAVSHPHHQSQSSQPPKIPPPQTEPGYHRKANPKRRFDGDVLSPVGLKKKFFFMLLLEVVFIFKCHNVFTRPQSYIRSFRDRQSDRQAYSHGRMMSRSRMAELDYDCGSQVPLTASSGPPVRI